MTIKPRYEPLDYQLADLLEELNQSKHNILRQTTLKVSQQTREGCIALACKPTHAKALLKTKVVGTKEQKKPLIFDQGFIYLNRYWSYQQRLSAEITDRLSFDFAGVDPLWINQRLAHYFEADKENNINWQQIAAALALSTRFLIISGGPGTGKTTTITRILALLIEQHQHSSSTTPLRFALAAPTGKAAMRMSESIRDAIQDEKEVFPPEMIEKLPQASSTLHRLLGYIPNSASFRSNKNNPLSSDIVIIDEASMIDLAMMTKLFEAIPARSRLILLGDKDQLSSVETGSVFTDLCTFANNQYTPQVINYLHTITEACVTTSQHATSIENHIVCLQKSWRFDQNSGIGQLATAINKGNTKTSLEILKNAQFPDAEGILSAELTKNKLLSAWEPYLNAIRSNASVNELFNRFNHFRILTALRRGMKGCVYLNSQLEKYLTQYGKLNCYKRWYHGRPIMITENSYRTGLFNGDIGITLQDEKTGQTKVWFQTKDGEKSFSPVRLPQHETTWVMTIHKSQGSEFNNVLMIFPTEDSPVLTRELIYTGITRAKQHITIVADPMVLKYGIEKPTAQATQIQMKLANDLK